MFPERTVSRTLGRTGLGVMSKYHQGQKVSENLRNRSAYDFHPWMPEIKLVLRISNVNPTWQFRLKRRWLLSFLDVMSSTPVWQSSSHLQVLHGGVGALFSELLKWKPVIKRVVFPSCCPKDPLKRIVLFDLWVAMRVTTGKMAPCLSLLLTLLLYHTHHLQSSPLWEERLMSKKDSTLVMWI